MINAYKKLLVSIPSLHLVKVSSEEVTRDGSRTELR